MEDLSAALGAARAALMQGDKATARAQLAAVLRSDAGNAQAWLLMSGIVATPEQQRDCLKRVLALDPANAAAQRGLASLDSASPADRSPAAPPEATPAPSALRRLAAAPGPTAPARPETAQPAFGMLPPAWPDNRISDNHHPPAAPSWQPAPAVPDLTAPAYGGAVAYVPPEPIPGQGRVPTIVIVLGVMAAVILGVCLFGSLLFQGLDIGPPPKPTISAQDRTIGFMNEFLAHHNNPAFFQRGQMKALARPVVEKYIVSAHRERLLSTLENQILGQGNTEVLALQASMLKQSYVANPQFRVVTETDDSINIEVTGGDQWFIFRDGQEFSRPLRQIMRRVHLENDNGVWYIDNIEF